MVGDTIVIHRQKYLLIHQLIETQLNRTEKYCFYVFYRVKFLSKLTQCAQNYIHLQLVPFFFEIYWHDICLYV